MSDYEQSYERTFVTDPATGKQVLHLIPKNPPSLSGAIHDAITALASAFAPRAIQQRKAATDDAIQRMSNGDAAQPPLGDQLTQ
jgi:hypothetical protein